MLSSVRPVPRVFVKLAKMSSVVSQLAHFSLESSVPDGTGIAYSSQAMPSGSQRAMYIWVVLSGARARDVRCYFFCEARELTQKVVQVAGHRLDDDAIDTSFGVLLDFVEDCVGVALEARLGVFVR